MSYLLIDSIDEKIELTKKIVQLTIQKNISLEEWHYILDTLLIPDILNSNISDEFKNKFTDIQEDLAYYDSSTVDPNYFWDDEFKKKLDIFLNMLGNIK